jgi:hypothetical protein
MTGGYNEIARLLAQTRARAVRLEVSRAVLRSAAQTLFCLLGGIAGIAAGARPGFARSVTLLGIAVALGLEAWGAIRAIRSLTESRLIALLTGSHAALRSALRSAAELGRDRDALAADGRFSMALVDGHLERTAREALALDPARELSPRPAKRAARALAAAAALLLVALLVPSYRAATRRLLVVEQVAAAAIVDPITGDVTLTLRFPAYMHREPRTVSGTGGEVRAPKGSEVELKTRADRAVKGAELEVELADKAKAAARRRHPLAVAAERELSGRFTVDGPGSYRFRFLDGRGRAVVEGPPIPIVVEPDAFPEVRIASPGAEVELQPGAPLTVDWQASDDVGLEELAVVTRAPGGLETRRSLRKFEGARRDAGRFELDLAPYALGEGEKLLYWLEVTDGDTVSGPKKAASATQAAKVYSEAEHRRRLLEEVRAAWEELVALLGDRLELEARGKLVAPPLLALAEPLDARARKLHEKLRAVAAAIRKEKAGPKEVARAVENVAGAVRLAEQRLSGARAAIVRSLAEGRKQDPGFGNLTALFDQQLDEELEKAILYLEQLLDQRRAEELVAMARDLAKARRDLADVLDRYRRAPTDAARKELLARISRMKERMNDLLRRMAEQAKGLSDEHMNADALAELARSKDVAGGLDEVEKALARGDVEAAMKALDAMGSRMDEMLAGLERTAGMPSEKNRELVKELRAFKQELDATREEQRKLGEETEPIREAWRRRMQEKLAGAEKSVAALERLAKEAIEAERAAEPDAPRRVLPDLEAARDGLETVQRALGGRDLPAALDAARAALGPAASAAAALADEARVADRYKAQGRVDGDRLREAQRQAAKAAQRAEQLKKELEGLVPHPEHMLGREERQRLAKQGQRQQAIEQRLGALQGKLSQLQQQAPVFPPSASGALGEARGHMGQAAGALAGGNVQRGRAEQGSALEGLDRFAKGLEQMAKGGGSGGGGFPLPFGGEGTGSGDGGDGAEPSAEKVEIPGKEAWRAPAEFRKDLLDAMKQGTPERYEGEVKRYYEELVK